MGIMVSQGMPLPLNEQAKHDADAGVVATYHRAQLRRLVPANGTDEPSALAPGLGYVAFMRRIVFAAEGTERGHAQSTHERWRVRQRP